jgi:F0F1-type ATP synthase assembly protein I
MSILNLGWLIVGNLALFLFGGIILDKHLGTTPAFLIGGMLLAFIGCGLTVYHTVQKLTRDEAKPGSSASRKPQE